MSDKRSKDRIIFDVFDIEDNQLMANQIRDFEGSQFDYYIYKKPVKPDKVVVTFVIQPYDDEGNEDGGYIYFSEVSPPDMLITPKNVREFVAELLENFDEKGGTGERIQNASDTYSLLMDYEIEEISIKFVY